jgi:alkylation response protein AidB-like acyl-CoA dehydrogenase
LKTARTTPPELELAMFAPFDSSLEPIIRFSEQQLGSRFRGEPERLREAWRVAGEFGLFRHPFPVEQGGLGSAPGAVVDALEAQGYGSGNNGLLFSFGAHMWAVIKPILDFGSESLKEELLPALFEGRAIGAHAASELGAGSDVMAMTTRFVESDAGYVLNGAKAWTTNAPLADVFIVFATEDPRLHFRGVSAFVVPRQTEGLSVLAPERKIGLHDSSMAQIVLEDCVIPKRNLLGKRRRGQAIFETSLSFERGLILTPYLGVMRRQIERCISFSGERRQFGRMVGQNQAVSHRIAGMVQRYVLSKLLATETAERLYAGRDAKLFASLCKLTLSENACASSQDAMRIFGATAFICDTAMDADVLDSLGGLVYSGTSEIQKNIICSEVGIA